MVLDFTHWLWTEGLNLINQSKKIPNCADDLKDADPLGRTASLLPNNKPLKLMTVNTVQPTDVFYYTKRSLFLLKFN